MAESTLIELYRSESRDHLERLSRAVLAIERGGGSKAVDEAFRSAHTLKGMSAAMGHRVVVGLAHGLEHLLDNLRGGVLVADAEVVDTILKGVDELERVVQEACAAPGAAAEDTRKAAGVRTPSPAQSSARIVRIAEDRIDDLVERTSELVIARERILRRAREGRDEQMRQLAEAFARSVGELREDALRLRLAPIGDIADRVERVVRDSARALQKQVQLSFDGAEIEIDRALLGDVQDLLTHLLRNAVDHGIEGRAVRVARGKPEEGRVRVIAEHDRDSVVLRVHDDGGGIDAEAVMKLAVESGLVAEGAGGTIDSSQLLRLLVRPGFSTAERVTELSGRGVGLDHVASRLREVGGELRVDSEPGRGSTFTLKLPRTLSQTKVLLVSWGPDIVGIPAGPLQRIEDEDFLAPSLPEGVSGSDYRDYDATIVELGEVLGLTGERTAEGAGFLVVLGEADRRLKLRVDTLIGLQDVVVRRFALPRGARDLFAGATILPDGTPCLVVEPNRLFADGELMGGSNSKATETR